MYHFYDFSSQYLNSASPLFRSIIEFFDSFLMSPPFSEDFNDVILKVILKLFQQPDNHCQYQTFNFLFTLTFQVTQIFEIHENFLSYAVDSLCHSKIKNRIYGFSILTALFERNFIQFDSLL
jgi:hypothetical protein